MASTKEYLDYILDILSDLEDITYRKMMGEYIIYYRNKIIGGIYDNRFLIKPTKSSKELILDVVYEIPYDTAKPMILFDVDSNKEFITKLFNAMYDELPLLKKK